MFIKSIFNIKSSFTKLLFLAILHSPLFAFSAKDIRFMTFENGLKLYLIEDTSSALVRMELRVGAGNSAQDEGNAGYFPLYARLKNAMIDSESATRLQICAPSDAEKAMQSLSEMLEPLQLSEKKLRSEINTEQVNTSMYASDSAGFINSAIEAKVFRGKGSRALTRRFSRRSQSRNRGRYSATSRRTITRRTTLSFTSAETSRRSRLRHTQKDISEDSQRRTQGRQRARQKRESRRTSKTEKSRTKSSSS